MSQTLQLSAEERDLLVEILSSRIGELRQEIHHSTVSTFTDQLKQTEILMKGLLTKVQSADAKA
jgi:hypothetical protein